MGAVASDAQPSAYRRPERPSRWPLLKAGFERSLAATRLAVIVPVVVLVLSALGAFAYGADVFVSSVRKVVDHPIPVGNKIGLFLLVIDLFLIGATMLIAAVGLYELFIGRLDPSQTPSWLETDDLNDLKARVVAMTVLVAAVSFIEVLVDLPSARMVLEVGGGVAAVIVALTIFLRFGGHGSAEG